MFHSGRPLKLIDFLVPRVAFNVKLCSILGDQEFFGDWGQSGVEVHVTELDVKGEGFWKSESSISVSVSVSLTNITATDSIKSTLNPHVDLPRMMNLSLRTGCNPIEKFELNTGISPF